MKIFLKQRKKSSKRFKLFCKTGLYINMVFLIIFLGSITYLAFPAFSQTYVLIKEDKVTQQSVFINF